MEQVHENGKVSALVVSGENHRVFVWHDIEGHETDARICVWCTGANEKTETRNKRKRQDKERMIQDKKESIFVNLLPLVKYFMFFFFFFFIFFFFFSYTIV